MEETKVIYPGSFDPFTNGHLAILKRGLEIFKSISIVVAHNSGKKSLFTTKERMRMINDSTADLQGVQVKCFEGLLVDYALEQQVNVILRGLRAGDDFGYEFQLALMNRRIAPQVQTVFLMTDYNWLYVSSSSVKEVASLGGDIGGLVPPVVIDFLCAKFPKLAQRRNHLRPA
ncbi:MAG: pantetheine-phosphate adenylyltransferase [Desulfarculales bacterium]|jgi:pantetheine-phosphate adenylyltransferase|nr:pantetheine-phosphate adenylyltransferase [Desulfarculales bacterium]